MRERERFRERDGLLSGIAELWACVTDPKQKNTGGCLGLGVELAKNGEQEDY